LGYLAVEHLNLVSVENHDVRLTELRQVLIVNFVLFVLKKAEAFANTWTPFLFHFTGAAIRAVKNCFEYSVWEFEWLSLFYPIPH